MSAVGFTLLLSLLLLGLCSQLVGSLSAHFILVPFSQRRAKLLTLVSAAEEGGRERRAGLGITNKSPLRT